MTTSPKKREVANVNVPSHCIDRRLVPDRRVLVTARCRADASGRQRARRDDHGRVPAARRRLQLGADRAARGPGGQALPGDVGNSPDGWNVLKADCSVDFVSPEIDFGDGKAAFDHMVGTNKGEGALPLSAVGRPK